MPDKKILSKTSLKKIQNKKNLPNKQKIEAKILEAIQNAAKIVELKNGQIKKLAGKNCRLKNKNKK